MRIVLASGSPRRSDLLRSAGFEFDVDAPDVDESRITGERPEEYVERLASAKARTVAARYPDRAVVGADTAVVIDGDVLGKPGSPDVAAAMLRRLSGREHLVITGVAVVCRGRLASGVEETTVRFEPLTESDVTAYIASGEPLDKAGAYAIQGLASRFVSEIKGSYSNVVGLPLGKVTSLLRLVGDGRP